MKSIQNTPVREEIDSLTIPEAEEIIEEALEELSFSTDPGLARALRFLAPPGYQAIVELCGENGRSKRRNASAGCWTPEEDELRIYFERIGEDADDEGNRGDAPVEIRQGASMRVPPAGIRKRMKSESILSGWKAAPQRMTTGARSVPDRRFASAPPDR